MIIISGFIVAFYKYRNHWIEIITVFSSAWYFLKTWLRCEQLAIFQSVRACPSLSPVSRGYVQLVSLLLSPRPKTIARRKQKQGKKTPKFLSLPNEQCLPHPFLEQGQSDTAEKLQLVIFFCLNPPMLSCLQVNLSWGICHGSSCFCI